MNPRRLQSACAACLSLRRGHLMGKLLVVMVIGGAVAAFKFTSAPASLLAKIKDHANADQDDQSSQREFLDTLGRLIERSKKVLAVHTRGATPYIEVVLWRDDAINPGVIDHSEVVVISHSLVTRSISAYSLAAGETSVATSRERAAASRPRGALPPGKITTSRAQSIIDTPLSAALLGQTSFCDRWRASPHVKPQVLASGISDLIVETLGQPNDELSLLRLTLRWAGNSADGPQEASVLAQVPGTP